MSIRFKIIAAVNAVFILYILIFNFILRPSYMRNFMEMEKTIVEDNVLTLKKIYLQQLSNIDTTTKDYAYWDDTFDYVRSRNPDYTQSNFTKETMKNLNINIVMILDEKNDIIFSTQYSEEDLALSSVSDEMKKTILDSIQNKKSGHSADLGYFTYDDEIYLMSHRQILKSDTSGVPEGSLIMIRYLDYEFKQNVIDNLRMEHNFIAHSKISEVLADSQIRSIKDTGVLVVSNEKSTYGYALVLGLDNTPAFLIDYQKTNNFYSLAKGCIEKNNYLLISVGLVALIISSLSIEFIMIRPIKHLVSEIKKIRTRKTMVKKIEFNMSGEMGDLAQNINEMLTSLEQFEKKTAEINVELENKAKELQDNSVELERLNKHMVGREIRMAELKNELEDIKYKLGNKPGDV